MICKIWSWADIMKVAIVYPDEIKKDWLPNMKLSWVNHGIASIIQYCGENGEKVDLIDVREIVSYKEFEEKISNYDLVGFSIMSQDVEISLELIGLTKKINENIKIVVGGVDPTVDIDKYIKNELIDYIIIGEGEIAFYKIIQLLKGDISSDSNDKIIFGEKIEDLDTIGYINRDIWSKENPNGYEKLKKPFFTLLSSRSCIYNCKFCQPSAKKMFGPKERTRSPENFVGELLMLDKKYGLNSFFILDDNAFQNKIWLEKFIELFKKTGIKSDFVMSGRSDNIYKNREFLPKLKEIGLKYVIVGFESGSDKILKYLKKGSSLKLNEMAACALHENGIGIQANIMFGFFNENKEDIKMTFDFVKKNKPEIFSPATFTPYPGSYLADEYKQKGLLFSNNSGFFRNPDTPKIKGVNYFYINWIIFRLGFYLSNSHVQRFRTIIYFIYVNFNISKFYLFYLIKTII